MKIKIAIKKYYDWKIQVVEIEEGAKMLGRQRLSSIHWVKYTSDLDAKIEEHNKIVKEIEVLEEKMWSITAQLFKKLTP